MCGVWIGVRVLVPLSGETAMHVWFLCANSYRRFLLALENHARAGATLPKSFSCLLLSVLIDPCVYIEYIEHILGWRTSKIKINVLKPRHRCIAYETSFNIVQSLKFLEADVACMT